MTSSEAAGLFAPSWLLSFVLSCGRSGLLGKTGSPETENREGENRKELREYSQIALVSGNSGVGRRKPPLERDPITELGVWVRLDDIDL